MKRLPLITSFILFIALCASAAYWAMQYFKPPVRAIAAPPQADRPAPRLDAAATLLGGHPAGAVATASNFQLKGVVVSGNPGESVAILAANGKPPKAVRVNHEVIPGVTVQKVERDHVMLLDGGVSKRVDLPAAARSRSITVAPPSATRSGLPSPASPALPDPARNPIRSDSAQQPREPAEDARFQEMYSRMLQQNPAEAARFKDEHTRKQRQNSNGGTRSNEINASRPPFDPQSSFPQKTPKAP